MRVAKVFSLMDLFAAHGHAFTAYDLYEVYMSGSPYCAPPEAMEQPMMRNNKQTGHNTKQHNPREHPPARRSEQAHLSQHGNGRHNYTL